MTFSRRFLPSGHQISRMHLGLDQNRRPVFDPRVTLELPFPFNQEDAQ